MDRLVRWAEIDVTALRDNASLVRSRLQPSVKLLAMVKSDGYGHGALTAARAALAGGATWLGVYTPDEALSLRRAGISEPVLVVGWSPPATLSDLIKSGIDVTVLDAADVDAVRDAAASLQAVARVHVKIDSGLGRLGVRPEAMDSLVRSLQAATGRAEVAGVFTHFADAEHDLTFTREQHERFLAAAATLRPVAPEAMLHACGSAAILAFPEMHHDLVRLGIALYGYAPDDQPAASELRPAMSVYARVAQVKTVSGGETVGYSRAWIAPNSRRIATVAIGYGQGVPRGLSNRGEILIAGTRCPIVGIVNMDQVTVDVTDADDVARGDVAMLFGERDAVRLGANEVAALIGTIPHELICRVSAHVPRFAVDGGPSASERPRVAVP
jgi:alanine racemase